MRSRPIVLLVSLGVAGIACAHAKTTDQAKTASAPSPSKDETTERQASGSAAKAHAPARHRDPSEVPVASSAHDLLQPGAEQQVRDKLVARGFMDAPEDGKARPSLRAPLQRFQDANDLPATGMPDAETLRKLGLDPDAVLRKATATGQTDGDASPRRPGGGSE